LRSWYGSSHSPELDAHRFRRGNLSSCNVGVNPSILLLVTETYGPTESRALPSVPKFLVVLCASRATKTASLASHLVPL
jgi:hypothetical protein